MQADVFQWSARVKVLEKKVHKMKWMKICDALNVCTVENFWSCSEISLCVGHEHLFWTLETVLVEYLWGDRNQNRFHPIQSHALNFYKAHFAKNRKGASGFHFTFWSKTAQRTSEISRGKRFVRGQRCTEEQTHSKIYKQTLKSCGGRLRPR